MPIYFSHHNELPWVSKDGILTVLLVGINHDKDSGLTWVSHYKTPLFSAIKVSFSMHMKKQLFILIINALVSVVKVS